MSDLNLQKGERIDLTKSHPGLKIAHVGCGWDVGDNFDLDASAFILEGGKLYKGNEGIIYFRHLEAHGVKHMGDNLTGVGDGDDEVMLLDLAAIPGDEVLIVVNMYEAQKRKQNFGMVNNAFIRVLDADTKEELAKFDLSEDYSKYDAMILGKLYKKDGEWKFQAIGTGATGDLSELAKPYM